jgi:hypothetical protein
VGLIKKNLAIFCEHLKEMVGVFNGQIQKNGLTPGDNTPTESIEEYRSKFNELTTALTREDIGKIDRLLAELEHVPFDSGLKKVLMDISDAVLMGEFTAGVKILLEATHGK